MPVRPKRGKWQWRFQVDGHTYHGMTDLVATERNKTAALRIEAKARELVLSGRAAELRVQIVPFSEGAEMFLKWADGEYRAHPSSARRIRTSFASLTIHFGDRPVNTLTAGTIEDYKAWRRTEHGIREVTLRHDLHALSVFIQYAKKQGWLRANPLDDVEIPSDTDAVRIHVLDNKEEAIYFNLARKYPTLYDLGRLILNQGCRPEEFLELRKAAVDLERGRFRIVSGKSTAAKRELRMTPESRDILARRMHGTSSWIFPSRKTDGHVLKVNNSHDKVLEASEVCECGCDRKAHLASDCPCKRFRLAFGLSFVIYDLRHTFATRAAERGMPPAALAAILGHADLRSLKKYIHVRQEAMDRAMDEYGERASFGPVDTAKSPDFTVPKVN